MGTNYYAKINDCEKCKRYDQIHLGKSSGGWQFSFQYNGGRFYKNVPEMKKWLSDKEITDEYGERVTKSDFWAMVKAKQKEKLNHADYVKEYHKGREDTDFKIDGYSFSDCEFS